MHEEEINRLVNMTRTYNESLRSETGEMSPQKFYMRQRIGDLIKKKKKKLTLLGHEVSISTSLKPGIGYSHLKIDGIEYTV